MENKELHIIVKFAEIDDISFEKNEKGWVTQFTEQLRQICSLYYHQKIKVFHKSESENISIEEFEHVDAILYILSPAFVFSSNLKQEINLLEKDLYFNIDLLNQKIFKILKGPINVDDMPLTISLGNYYPFFEYRDEYNDEYETLAGNNAKSSFTRHYWESFSDIVYDLLAGKTPEKVKTIFQKLERNIYLGRSNRKQLWHRLGLKRELKDFGLNVLPDSDYSVEVKYLDNPDNYHIGKSDIAIHFPDEFIPISQEKLNKISLSPEIKRLIWFNPEMEIDTDTKRAYNELKRNLKSFNHVEAIDSNIQDLKDIVKAELFKKSEKASIYQFVKNPNKKYLYLIYHVNTDKEQLENTLNILINLNIEILHIQKAASLVDRRNYHYEYLKSADFCLLLHNQHAGEEWLLSNIKEVKKSAGLNRNTPFENKGILTNQLDLQTSVQDKLVDFETMYYEKTIDFDQLSNFLNPNT